MSDIDKVKYIISPEGGKKFKAKLTEIKNLASDNSENAAIETIGIQILMDKIEELKKEETLLKGQAEKPNYSNNERETIRSYISELNNVITLLGNRTRQMSQSLISTMSSGLSEVDGGRRTIRRKSSRRKSIRKSGRRSRKTGRRKY